MNHCQEARDDPAQMEEQPQGPSDQGWAGVWACIGLLNPWAEDVMGASGETGRGIQTNRCVWGPAKLYTCICYG